MSAFIAAFGFVEDAYDKLALVAQSFFGRLSQADAEKHLGGKEPGTYLTWVDNKHGRCMVSYIEKKKPVHKTICWLVFFNFFFWSLFNCRSNCATLSLLCFGLSSIVDLIVQNQQSINQSIKGTTLRISSLWKRMSLRTICRRCFARSSRVSRTAASGIRGQRR